MKTAKIDKKIQNNNHNYQDFGLSTTTSQRKRKFGKINCCFVIATRPREVIKQQMEDYLAWKRNKDNN